MTAVALALASVLFVAVVGYGVVEFVAVWRAASMADSFLDHHRDRHWSRPCRCDACDGKRWRR